VDERIGRRHPGYNRRSKVEASISRYKRVIGDAWRSREERRGSKAKIVAVKVFYRMLELGLPTSIRPAQNAVSAFERNVRGPVSRLKHRPAMEVSR
jgi:hypothetical protein